MSLGRASCNSAERSTARAVKHGISSDQADRHLQSHNLDQEISIISDVSTTP